MATAAVCYQRIVDTKATRLRRFEQCEATQGRTVRIAAAQYQQRHHVYAARWYPPLGQGSHRCLRLCLVLPAAPLRSPSSNSRPPVVLGWAWLAAAGCGGRRLPHLYAFVAGGAAPDTNSSPLSHRNTHHRPSSSAAIMSQQQTDVNRAAVSGRRHSAVSDQAGHAGEILSSLTMTAAGD